MKPRRILDRTTSIARREDELARALVAVELVCSMLASRF